MVFGRVEQRDVLVHVCLTRMQSFDQHSPLNPRGFGGLAGGRYQARVPPRIRINHAEANTLGLKTYGNQYCNGGRIRTCLYL